MYGFEIQTSRRKKYNEIELFFCCNKRIKLNCVSNLNQGEEFSSVWFVFHIFFSKTVLR